MNAPTRSLALAGAAALDAALGEPAGRWHPVAVLGGLLSLAHEPLRASWNHSPVRHRGT